MRSESSVFLSRVESGYLISVEVRLFGVQHAVNERLVQLDFLHGQYSGSMGTGFSVCQNHCFALGCFSQQCLPTDFNRSIFSYPWQLMRGDLPILGSEADQLHW